MTRNAKRRFWTKRELATVLRLYPDMDTKLLAAKMNRSVISIYQRAQIAGIGKSKAYAARLKALECERLIRTGARYRFQKGNVPSNAGLRRPGWSAGRMRETQFKKGARPHTWKPVGSHRFSKEGYLCRKMTDTGYPPRDWVPVHLLMWIEANGPVPPMHAVCFKDKDRTHIELGNLELLSRADLMRRNSFRTNYPKEIQQVIQLRGALQRQINRRERNAE
jgi:HNH endonuclease